MAGLLQSVCSFVPMMAAQQAGRQSLDRTPETESEVTDAPENVIQYDRVMGTKLVLGYAAGLETIFRASESCKGTALDLACGPGHFTLCLARFLGYESVRGIDLSDGMVTVGNANAAKAGLGERARFTPGDVTKLTDVPSASVDLVTFNNAAHHMPDLETVALVLDQMQRVTRPEGLIVLMDLVRLRTEALTEHYVDTLGADYLARGLPAFLKDFHDSMYAAWTAKELRTVIPTASKRHWYHLVPRGLPTLQIILGLPEGRKRLFVRKGLPWKPETNPVPGEMRAEHALLRQSLFWFGSRTHVAAGK